MLEEKDIKKGNLVECLENVSPRFTKGKIYKIYVDGLFGGNIVRIEKNDKGYVDTWFTSGFKLHKPKEDLRDLLKVGYKIGFIPFMGAYTMEVLDYETLKIVEGDYDCCLIDKMINSMKINEIYKPKYNGIKPMDWVMVWKREEHKYMLVFPKEMYEIEQKLGNRNDIFYPIGMEYKSEQLYKSEFTQEEINAIPFNTDMFEKIEVE